MDQLQITYIPTIQTLEVCCFVSSIGAAYCFKLKAGNSVFQVELLAIQEVVNWAVFHVVDL